ncbi:hypothetical protein FHS79_001664 [Polymorphobacter multimanifer]|uniref:Aerotolerance regulator N-terminal domain-containing protein n=1 Tax=Polymorphobacter multimanifer TaxID=1070431 RepID=A0A841LEV3_9SPHN|nr:BatA domain-containing protein [Polymorphobacter multimanifer]MBB6227498.1 hypothetical protein [Polymorphobacter multimanifer]
MPGFLFPLGLLGLLAVVLPLAIHLARRSDADIIDFAALRWLRAAPRPRAQIRFDEVPLLLLRLLLVVLLALLLAQPIWRGWTDRRPVLVVFPGADLVEARAALASAGDARALWLTPGFPDFGEIAPPAGPVSSLVRELDSTLAAQVPLTILVPGVLQGVDAELPRLSRPVQVRILEGAMPALAAPVEKLAFAARGPATDPGLRWLRAAATGLGAGFDLQPADAPMPPQSSILLWLGSGTPPDPITNWVASGGTALVMAQTQIPAGTTVWRDAQGPIAEASPLGRGRLIRFVRPLTPAALPALLEPDFPQALAALLQPPPEPARVSAEGWQPRTGGPAPVLAGLDLSGWLGLAIALGWLIERWVATRSRRAARP